MINKNKRFIDLLLLAISAIIFISTFLTWFEMPLLKLTAVDLGRGALNGGKIGFPQIEILLISIFPVLVVLLLFIEFQIKKELPFILYFIISLFLMILIIRNGSIEIGPILAFIGSLSLCITSLIYRRKNT